MTEVKHQKCWNCGHTTEYTDNNIQSRKELDLSSNSEYIIDYIDCENCSVHIAIINK